MAELGQVLREVVAKVRAPYDGSKVQFEFNKFKEDCLRRAVLGKTHAEMLVSTDDIPVEEAAVLGAELANLIKEEGLEILNFDDRNLSITISVTWRNPS